MFSGRSRFFVQKMYVLVLFLRYYAVVFLFSDIYLIHLHLLVRCIDCLVRCGIS